MVSPFKAFRKRQKMMIAILAILAMFAFVVLPIVLQGMGSRRVRNLPVVSTRKYGNIDEAAMQGLLSRRQALFQFFRLVQQDIAMAGRDPRAIQGVENAFGPATEEAVVETWLYANRARELGLVVPPERINQFIASLTTAQGITQVQVKQILASMRLSQNQFFEMLHHELLALELRLFFQLSLGGVPPAQRWDYYQRLNRKVTIEAMPVPVSQFVDQVANPSEATLKEFFERFKNDIKGPSSPEPGFMEPKKVSVEYLKADYDLLLQQELDRLTQEDIENYYEEHRDDYRQEELPTAPGEKPSEPEEPVGPELMPKADSGRTSHEESPPARVVPTAKKEPAEEQPPAKKTSPGKEKPAAKQMPPAEEKPASEEETSGHKEEPAHDTQQQAAEKEPAAALPAAKPGENSKEQTESGAAELLRSKATDTDDDTSWLYGPSPLCLVSLLQGPVEEDESPADEASNGRALADGDKQPQEVPEEKQPPHMAAEKPAEADLPSPSEVARPAGTGGGSEKSAGPETKQESQRREKSEPVEVRYLPLKEVEGEVRRALARQRVEAKIDEAFRRVEDAMRQYGDKLFLYDPESGKAPPKPPDLSEAFRLLRVEKSKKDGSDAGKKEDASSPETPAGSKDTSALARHETGLISASEMATLDIGRSNVADRGPFVDFALGENCPSYRPATAEDVHGNRYIFWKKDDAEQRILEWDEPGVRDRVLYAWKMVQARELAKQEAEKLAATARQSEKPLEELFANQPNRQVVQTEPFSWLTYGAFPAWWARTPPRISQIKRAGSDGGAEESEAEDAVEMPGNDFMRAVFSLDKGGVGIAVNQPETIAYVVRVTDVNPLPDVLWRLFLNEDYDRYGLAATYDQFDTLKAWQEEIEAEAGLEWNRPPREKVGRRRG